MLTLAKRTDTLEAPRQVVDMHDLQRIRQDLQESLSLDKHPVSILLGAGCPSAIRIPNASGSTDPLIPDLAGLTASVTAALAADANFKVLAKQFAEDGKTCNIEDLLSRVRVLRRIVGKGDARGLNEAALAALEVALCTHVVEAVRKDLPGTDTPYHQLAEWIGGVARKSPVHLFTTNYDLLLEQALEDRALPFFDGFVGARRPFFDLRAIEDDEIPARWTRLWKLHGCASWSLEPDGRVTRVCQSGKPGEGLLIHPSELKYDQSRRMPYLAMIDRLRTFLRLPSAVLVTVGYSFADEHLNEVVLQGLRSNPNAAAFGLLYKRLEEEAGASGLSAKAPSNLSLLARDRGVVRTIISEWMVDRTGGTTTPVTNDLGDFRIFSGFLRGFVRGRGA